MEHNFLTITTNDTLRANRARLAKEGSEQKRRKVKKGGSLEAIVVSAPATDVKQLSRQYNMFTQDYVDIVNKTGTVIKVEMTDQYKQKMFPTKKRK